MGNGVASKLLTIGGWLVSERRLTQGVGCFDRGLLLPENEIGGDLPGRRYPWRLNLVRSRIAELRVGAKLIKQRRLDGGLTIAWPEQRLRAA